MLDLADISDLLADLTNIEGIVVAPCLGLGMRHRRIFPCLRERAIVPDITMVWEAVADETQPALLDVLFDGVERLLLANLHLGVGPTWHLDDHVEDKVGVVSKEWDIVEGRDDRAILLDVDAMLESVGSADEADGILRSHWGWNGREKTKVMGETTESFRIRGHLK